jgi:drug/metabolite transporter (DMT)-like permease
MPSIPWLFPLVLSLVGGAASSVLNKALYHTNGIGEASCHNPHAFKKPYFLTVTTFIGESLCLLVYYLEQGGELLHRGKKSSNKSKSWLSFHNFSDAFYNPSGETENIIEELSHWPEVSPTKGDHNEQTVGNLALAAAVENKARDVESNHEETPLIGENHSNSNNYSEKGAGNGAETAKSAAESAEEANNNKPKPHFAWYFLFSFFDLTGTFCMSLGLVLIPASISTMLRGSTVIFSEILGIIFLKQKTSVRHSVAVLLVALGLAGVGLSNTLRAHHSKNPAEAEAQASNVAQQILGISLTLLSSLFNSIQNVFEEKILKSKKYRQPHPLQMVGYEGLCGTLQGVIVLIALNYIPGYDCGAKVENLHDSVDMLFNRENVTLVLLYYPFLLSRMLSNWGATAVSKILSSVHRNISNAVRTIFVWITEVILFYWLGTAQYGEKLDEYSMLQVVGFGFLLTGSLMYGFKRKSSS